MTVYPTALTHTEDNLRYIGEHKLAFDIEPLYPLDLLEELVRIMHELGCGIVCGCNVERDRLYPARFYLTFERIASEKQAIQQTFNAALNFLRQVEKRPEVRINYKLLQQFIGTGLEIDKVQGITIGVDARPDLTDTRLKMVIFMKNYPEKMATAIAMCGENRDWSALLANNKLLMGFDFFLNGHSAIEIYPSFDREDLQRADVQMLLKNMLPPPALPLLAQCTSFQFGISPENESDALYFNCPPDPNYFVENLNNEMAKKVHSYYRHQPFKYLLVGIPQAEFFERSIESVKMYYYMTDLK
jgi:LynF/TruF/PatF family peptide O-prenyltransferase